MGVIRYITFGLILLGVLAGVGAADEVLSLVAHFWKPIAVGAMLLFVFSGARSLLWPSDVERFLRTPTIRKTKYGIIAVRANGTVIVRAPSGEEAIRISGWDMHTPEGENFLVANHMVGDFVPHNAVHKGQGIFEVRVQPWPDEY